MVAALHRDAELAGADRVLRAIPMKSCSVIIVDPTGQVLLQKRDDRPDIQEAGKWDLFGGHCEEGEDARACLRRELDEEMQRVFGVWLPNKRNEERKQR